VPFLRKALICDLVCTSECSLCVVQFEQKACSDTCDLTTIPGIIPGLLEHNITALATLLRVTKIDLGGSITTYTFSQTD
jgi:hypothetical protein